MNEKLKRIMLEQIGKEVSDRTYYNTIGGLLSYGFIVNMIMVATMGDMVRTVNIWAFLIAYFVSCFAGSMLIFSSRSAVVEFIGYNLIVIPIGALLAICLPEYNLNDIAAAFATTLVVTFAMIIISNLNPNWFRSLGKGLLTSLFLLIVVECVFAILGFYSTIIDIIACGIFCLYIGYDWVKASENYKSINTAIMAAASLYLDIINLFIRILSIISGSNSKSSK